MTERRPPYPGRRTRPLPREELAPISAVEDPPETRPALEEAKELARDAEDDIVTMVPCPRCDGSKKAPCASCAAAGIVAPTRASAIQGEVTCPLCCGGGRIAPEIATTFDGLIAQVQERA
jgi:DnaJ-class molecular chaperone